MGSITMQDIERRTKTLADVNTELTKEVGMMKAEIDAVKTQRMREIRKLIVALLERRREVKAMVSASPELFEKPRTQVFWGIKVGIQKGKGKIVIIDEKKTLERILNLYPDRAEFLIITQQKPNKEELEKMAAADLKKLGCHITGDEDTVIARPVDGEIGKMVSAIEKEVSGEDA